MVDGRSGETWLHPTPTVFLEAQIQNGRLYDHMGMDI